MHPVLFRFNTPEFLRGFLPEVVQIYMYGFMIACGALAAFYYTGTQGQKRFGQSWEKTTDFALLLIIAAVIGGKVLYYLENPGYYLASPKRMFQNFSAGFVFLGSLLFCIPAMLWYFKKNKLPVWPMLDTMAITTCIVHAFGRIGCFMAGCCYGVPTDAPLGVVFDDPHSLAKPLHTALHPTQLYDAGLIVSILLVLNLIRRYKRFDGQVFLTYLILYSVGRAIVEEFRGDEGRGYVFNGLLSHSQFMGLLIVLVSAYFYVRFWKSTTKEAKRS